MAKTTRRDLIRGTAVAALSLSPPFATVAAVAAGPDPIFNLIAQHRAAYVRSGTQSTPRARSRKDGSQSCRTAKKRIDAPTGPKAKLVIAWGR
jgi:MFS superfamily sulfate permease-like transporter